MMADAEAETRDLLREAVARPAMATVARLNDAIARRFAKIATTALNEYGAAHAKRPATMSACLAAESTANWLWALPALLLRRPPPADGGGDSAGAMADQIGDDPGQSISVQDTMRRRMV